jgi:glycosyltransferase involved in cell wall biosynthesis
MKLLVNTSLLRFGGATQVAASFLIEARSFPEHEYHVALGPGVASIIAPEKFPENFNFYPTDFGEVRISKLNSIKHFLTELEHEVQPDCFLTTAGPAYYRPIAPHIVGFNRPLYLYEESPYVRSLKLMSRLSLTLKKRFHVKQFQREADWLIVQTEDVRLRVQTLLGNPNVYTVTNTCNSFFENPKLTKCRLPPKPRGQNRFLTVTSFYPHKNLDICSELLKHLSPETRKEVNFVYTLDSDIYKKHIGPQIPEEITLTGPVPAADCPSLYQECDFMFLPTLAECFSASYAEAMKMGKPIVTTDLGFARSICGEAALYYTPADPKSAAATVEHLIRTPELQQILIQKGKERLQTFDSAFSRARKILSLCDDLLRVKTQN